MLKEMSNRLAVSLGRQLQASNSDVEVYAYGLEIMLGVLVKFAWLIVLAVVFGLLWPVILVSFGLFGFRYLGGGSHLSTYLRCLVFGLTVILGLAWFSTFISNSLIISVLLGISVIWGVMVIIDRVPAGTEKKTITDPEQILKQKLKTFVFMLLWCATSWVLLYIGHSLESCALILGGLMGIFSISTWGYSFTNGLDILFNQIERRYCNG
jgi:accessory gene regulator B